MDQEQNYISENTSRFHKELFSFLSIPSISAQAAYKKDIKKAANYLKKLFEDAKISNCQIFETIGNPLVYAEKIVDENLPTILVYGHYDVQPPEPLNEWYKDPFNPYIKDNKVFGRGSADDKGQVFMHLKALEICNHFNTLRCNLKYIIEGEEEMGSAGIKDFLEKKKNLELLKSDLILVSDTEMLGLDKPSIPISLRGIVTFDVEVIGPNRDLHSGVYGGSIANPIETLCNLISMLKDDDNKIIVPKFYENVPDNINGKFYSSKLENDQNENYQASTRKLLKDLEVNDLKVEKGYNCLEGTSIRPSLEINGIWGGYTNKEGFKTVIPSKAFAKLSIRTVPNQNSEKISKNLKSFLEINCPKHSKINIKITSTNDPLVTDPNSNSIKIARKSIQKVFGKNPILTREGGSIPILVNMQKKLNAPTLLLGFGLQDNKIHSPNENFNLKSFDLGLKTIIDFYKSFSK